MKKIVLGCAASVLLMATSSIAQAATTIASAYTRVSTEETVTAPFTLAAGTSTVRAYTGPVEILVSGTGFSLGSNTNDAFGPFGTGYYSLGMGTSAQPLSAFNPTRSAARFITFIEGVGAVPLGTAPAYDNSHTYRFVADLGSLSSLLSFSVLDGQYSDYGGAYNISLWQLRPGASTSAVPEPASWMMMILGFGAIGAMVRRRNGAVSAAAA